MPVAKRKSSGRQAEPDVTVEASDDLDTSLARELESSIPLEIPEGALRYRDIYVPPPPPSTCSYDNKGPRLIIKNIVVKNFKSFYGIHTIGPFFKGMSSVIGPNGSGKSNVLDSILFVFGYRASKIRTKKVSMLIHNSAGHPNCNSCTVTVNFIQVQDNNGPQEDAEEIPGTDLEVSRTAMRDNSSYYTLEGKRVQFKDIAFRLQAHGIDLNNGRFLILQGEVEQIAQMKPKAENENDTGLLEFLEEIIGTLRYKEPLTKAIALDTEMEENREVHKTKADNAQQQLANLEEGKNAAISYLEEENKYNRAWHFILQKNCFKAEQKIEIGEGKINEKTEEFNKIKAELADFEEKSKDLRNNIKLKEDAIKDCKSQSEDIDKKYKENDAEFAKVSANMSAKNQRRKKLGENVTTEKKKLEDMTGLPEKNQKDINDLEKLIQRHENEKADFEAKLLKATDTLQEKVREPQEKLVVLEKELAGLSKTKEEKAAKMQTAQSVYDLATKAESKGKEKLNNLTKTLKESTAGLNEKQERLENVKKDLPTAKGELNGVMEQLQTQRTDKAQSEQKVARLRAELQGMRTAAEKSKSANKLADALREECAAGRIPGVYGRLGDLGAIDAKYDYAITSASGSLDNILVDTVETGAKCLKFLRDNQLGKAYILSLEQQTKNFGRRMNEPFSAPENVPRLFDLIKVEDDRVRPAMYFAVRDCLVANTLEQATRIGLGGRTRYRVVDLKGNVVDPGGAMTGGGRARRGGMGQKVTAGLVEETQVDQTPQMKQSIEEYERRIAKLVPSITALERQEDQLKSRISQLEAEHKRLTMDIQHLSKNIPLLEKQIKEQKDLVAKTVSDDAKVAKLQEELDAAKEALEKASSSAEKVETKVKQLCQQVEDIRNNAIGGMDTKVKDLKKKITKAQSDKTKLSAAIANNERNMQKCQEKITDMEEEIEKMKEDLLKMKANKENIAAESKEMMEQKSAIGEKEIELHEQYEKLKKEINKKHSEEKEIKSKKIDMEREMEKINEAINDAKADLKKQKNNFKTLRLENISGKEPEKPFEIIPPEELPNFDLAEYTYVVATFNDITKKNKPNMDIIEEYKTKETQFITLCDALEEATNKRDEVRNFLSQIKKQRYQEFMTGFKIINQKLKEVFRMISIGGDAELELQDTFNPFLEGIAFSVRPRNKAWTQIDRLSGGEKTLSSLALVFGLHYFKPSPFYMMDEIDAALDTRNVSIIGHYIKKFTINCQFIVISLRAEMYDLFERRIIGVYKPDGCTRVVAIDPRKFNRKFGKQPEPAANKEKAKPEKPKPTTATTSSQSSTQSTSEKEMQPPPDPLPARKKSNPAKRRKFLKQADSDSFTDDSSVAESVTGSQEVDAVEDVTDAPDTPVKMAEVQASVPETPETPERVSEAVSSEDEEEEKKTPAKSSRRRLRKLSSQESVASSENSDDNRRKSKRQKSSGVPEPSPSPKAPTRRSRRGAADS